MTKYIKFTILTLLLQVLSLQIYAQEVPQFIHYQGNLASINGNPVNDNLQMIFSIYAQQTAGSRLWGPEIHNGVVVEDGLFNVQLGTIIALSADVFQGTRYLEIGVAGETLAPRQRIGSIAYALVSETVPDGAVTSNKIADGAVTQSKLAGNISHPDYDSGWRADDNRLAHKERFSHNLGVIPMRLEIWFSPEQFPKTVYSVRLSWHNKDMGPVSISGTADSIYLHISTAPL